MDGHFKTMGTRRCLCEKRGKETDFGIEEVTIGFTFEYRIADGFLSLRWLDLSAKCLCGYISWQSLSHRGCVTGRVARE